MRRVSSEHMVGLIHWVFVGLGLALVTSAVSGCARAPSAAGDGSAASDPSPTTVVSGGADDRLAIYATMIRELAGAEGPSWDRVFVVTDICANAAGAADPGRCADVLSPTDQQALIDALPRLSDHLRFVDDPTTLYTDAWFDGTGPSTVVIRVGPVVRTSAGVTVGASYGCGGLCGSGTTYQLESTPDGWTVTGTNGVTWIA
jgi:hypothetical protein